jgi:putative ABC transport system permease protein
MKAIGSQNAFLLTYLFIEVLIVGILGSIIGFAAGSFLSTGLSKAIFDSSMELKWAVLPLVGTIGVLIILGGSLWPLRQAITLEPAQALKDL